MIVFKARFLRFLVASCVLAALFATSLFVGVSDINLSNLLQTDKLEILLVSRFPRSFAVVLTGCAMSVAGLVMQMIVHNRFVEPTTAGTAQGAGLGLLLAMLFFPQWSVFGKMLAGSATAIVTMLIFLRIARRIPHQDPLLLPLVGLIFGGVIGALVTFIAYEYDMLQVIEIWFNGDFASVLSGRYELLWISGGGLLILYFLADRLTIVGMGEQMSLSLGINYRHLVLLAMTMVSIITALVVITVGMIPFVELH